MELSRLLSRLVLLAVVGLVAGMLASAAEAGGKPDGSAGNNLSYPVIWAEGETKVLRGEAGMTPETGGVWWYQWGTNGTDPTIEPASCLPDPDEGDTLLNPSGLFLCDDGAPGTVNLDLVAGTPPADSPVTLARAHVQ